MNHYYSLRNSQKEQFYFSHKCVVDTRMGLNEISTTDQKIIFRLNPFRSISNGNQQKCFISAFINLCPSDRPRTTL